MHMERVCVVICQTNMMGQMNSFALRAVTQFIAHYIDFCPHQLSMLGLLCMWSTYVGTAKGTHTYTTQ